MRGSYRAPRIFAFITNRMRKGLVVQLKNENRAHT